MKIQIFSLFVCLLQVTTSACSRQQNALETSLPLHEPAAQMAREQPHLSDTLPDNLTSSDIRTGILLTIEKDVTVGRYFRFIDSLANAWNELLPYRVSEHIIVHHNYHIIDSLVALDYYVQMSKGRFIYDLREVVILHQGDTIFLPDSISTAAITNKLENTVIDVNIPEFKLRILENDTVKYTFNVRVGRNERKYLATAGREVSLRTPIGNGRIVRIETNPYFVNPATGRSYTTTLRDDGQRTRMPRIPWLEPEIGGQRQGALIHPTTNPETLGKAYSNGCIGTGEGDAWIIYYHAPLNTTVRFRYQLEVIGPDGETTHLKDIYQLKRR